MFLSTYSFAQELPINESYHYVLNFPDHSPLNLENPNDHSQITIDAGRRTLFKIKQKFINSQGQLLKYLVEVENINELGQIETVGEYIIWAQSLHSYLSDELRNNPDRAPLALATRMAELGLQKTQVVTNPAQGSCPPINEEVVPARSKIENLHASEHLLQLLIQFEGVRSRVYDCSAGCATIGVGHKISQHSLNSVLGRRDVQSFWQQIGHDSTQDTLSENEAKNLLRQDLQIFEQRLKDNLGNNFELTQNEFDSLLSWTYNLGPSYLAANSETGISRALQNKNFPQVSREMLRWTKVRGNVQVGLVKRRLIEALNFMGLPTSDLTSIQTRLERILSLNNSRQYFLALWNEQMTNNGRDFSFEKVIKYINEH